MQHDTAGDACSGLKWTRKTTGKIRDELAKAGIPVSRNTVGRLLKNLGYSLRVNHKKIARGSPETRDRQFRYIAQLKEAYQGQDLPVVSVDTKKKELVGRFKNPGRVWTQTPLLVNDHDFRSEAKGLAVPYGVFDLGANRGRVVVGTSHDTPAFAVDALVDWWVREGRRRYPAADHLLVLADNGGSNGSRVRAWKHALQTKLCDRFGFAVTVCHYPPGASKWNPIEHRMFSEISKNWAGAAPRELRDRLEVHPDHPDRDRSPRRSDVQPARLPDRCPDRRPRAGHDQPGSTRRPTRLELHALSHVSETAILFLTEP